MAHKSSGGGNKKKQKISSCQKKCRAQRGRRWGAIGEVPELRILGESTNGR